MLPFLMPALGKQLVPIAIGAIIVGGLVFTHLIKDDRANARMETHIKVASAHQCNSDRLDQTNTALVNANEQREAAVKNREAELADAAKTIETLELELGKIRNAPSKPTDTAQDSVRACIPANDPWLRHWQGRTGGASVAGPGRS